MLSRVLCVTGVVHVFSSVVCGFVCACIACACPCFCMRAGVSACGGVRGVQRVKCVLRAFIVGGVFRV